jgi:tetratricopeptide (TPR) repeat protein
VERPTEVFVSWALQGSHWPFLFVLLIPVTFWFWKQYLEISFKETFHHRKLWITVLVEVVAVVLFFAFRNMLSARPVPKLDANRIVVAPFINETGEDSLDYLGAMTVDRIVDGLTQVESETRLIHVVPSVLSLGLKVKGPSSDSGILPGLRALAEATHAGVVVSGSYHRYADSIRFTAAVFEPVQAEAVTNVEPISGLFSTKSALIENLRQAVMAALAATVDSALLPYSAARIRFRSYDAEREYLRGLQSFNRGGFSDAISHLGAAKTLDSSFHLASLTAATAYMNIGQYAQADSVAKSLAVYRSTLPEFERAQLDWLSASLAGNREAALAASHTRADLVPLDRYLYQWGLDALYYSRPRELLDAYARINLSDPWFKDWWDYWYALTQAYHVLGQHSLERAAAQNARERHPTLRSTLLLEMQALAAQGQLEDVLGLFHDAGLLPTQQDWPTPDGVMLEVASLEFKAHGHRQDAEISLDSALSWYSHQRAELLTTDIYRYPYARVLYLRGRWAEAEARIDTLLKNAQQPSDSVNYMGYLGVIAARRGLKGRALRISEQLVHMDRAYLYGSNTRWEADILAQLGDRDRALALLITSLGQGLPFTIDLHRDVDLEPLWEDGRFKQLVRPRG